MNDFLERLTTSDYFNIIKTTLKDSVYIEELNNKDFYVIQDYIVTYIDIDKVVLKIYPEEMIVNYYKMWKFFNSRRLLKNIFTDIQGDGNTIIISLNSETKEVFTVWYSLLLFPVQDQQYKNYKQTCLLLDHLVWDNVVSNNSIFVLPYSLKEHKLIAYTHLGQIYCNNSEYLPLISEGISQISFSKSVKEYPQDILGKKKKKKNMWVENDKLNFTIPSSKNNKRIQTFSSVLKKTLSINYQNSNGIWKIKNNVKSKKSYPFKITIRPYYDKDDLHSIKYNTVL